MRPALKSPGLMPSRLARWVRSCAWVKPCVWTLNITSALSKAWVRASPKRSAVARCPSTSMGRTTLIESVFADGAVVRDGLDVEQTLVGLEADAAKRGQVAQVLADTEI